MKESHWLELVFCVLPSAVTLSRRTASPAQKNEFHQSSKYKAKEKNLRRSWYGRNMGNCFRFTR